MTKEEFKRRWESNEGGGGITNNDCAECVIKWGLCPSPRTMPIDDVIMMAIKAAGIDVPPRTTDNQTSLLEEKERLLARIKEIDALLGEANGHE